ncbi:hypothetical protein EIN_429790 [Entamoeba invadens IP1]|uniref:Uncharacterized protein n=2 Tax=Entamoeba invadens TaxID=33085 RepID=A0A0A1UFD7_ENTIV|nr:hypothetical protein EIN_429790 [Entamoeba invadens IP1]ELP95203.1 hypothetical protein EIN_429790 [Entamoeba invadens IP1]BAN40479.1 hypothetical protein [Entamoeba invadens]BAN41440.1 hypothetical protein [Entamoeba invadens]|eukprot:XP_004261974.1 hypothetical protein EIN_429790 [Entamoeba invadens IP1]
MIAVFFTLCLVHALYPKEGPVFGYSNDVTFEIKVNETCSFDEFYKAFQSSVASEVQQVVYFVDYNINTDDFEKFTTYDGYSVLRSGIKQAKSSFEGERTNVTFEQVIEKIDETINNKVFENRTVYLFSDAATLTDNILLPFSYKTNVKYVNQDFYNITGKALIIFAFRNVASFERLQENNEIMRSFFAKNENTTQAVFYSTLRLVEKNTINEATWYNMASTAFIFTILIWLILMWFLLYFMLRVQSIGPAVLGKPKTD